MADKQEVNPEVILALSVIITGFFCLFGFVGNILALIALIKDKCKNSNVYLLSALAVADWFMLAFIFNGVVVIQFCKYFEYTSYIHYLKNSPALQIIWVVGCIVQTNSIWYVVAVTGDRFLAVCCPFESIKGKSNSIKRAKKLIATVLLFSIIFNFPRFFHYYPVNDGIIVLNETETPDKTSSSQINNVSVSGIIGDYKQDNMDVWELNTTPIFIDSHYGNNNHSATTKPTEGRDYTQVWENKWYFYIYYISISWLVLYIIPLCTLLILNILLLRQIRKAQQNRTTLLGSKSRESDSISVTANIVAVVTTFIICQAPDFIHTLVDYPAVGTRVQRDYIKAAAYAFLAFNSSTNFIIYCLFYQRFRKTVFKMCCINTSKYSTQFLLHKLDSRRTSQTSQTYL